MTESKQRLLEALQRPAPYAVQVQNLTISAPPRPWTIPMAIPVTVPASVQRRMMKGKAAGVPRELVRSVNMTVEPGQVCAIVGGSGSGKTTLLHAIAARESNLLHSGTVQYTPCSPATGEAAPPKRKSASTKVTAEKVVGFVAQNDDTLLPYLTVREQLSFAAALRLPTSVDSQTRKAIVEETLNELGLREVADVLVGGGLRKGISGGEKRRLNVACILVTLPSVLILDEPTTGLDSFTAFALLETLQNLARRGRSIILSIHQPRSDAFRLLSKVVLLSQGSVVYSGPRIDMISHFKSLGLNPPDRANPLDWVVDISSIDTRDDEAENASRERVGRLVKAWREHELGGGQIARPDGSEAEEGIDDIEQGIQRTVSRGSTIKRERPQNRPNVVAQCWLLTGRGLRNVSRNYGQTVGSLLQAVIIGVGLGLAFLRPPQTPGGIQSLKTVVYQSSPAMYYLSTVVYVYILCDELVVFDREREDRLYEAVPAALALFFSALPTAIIAPTIYALIIYFMCGLRTDNLAVNLLSFIAQSIMQQLGAFTYALLAASINRSFAQASLLANGFAIIFVLTSGYLITDLPVWISWSRWLSPYFYGFNWIGRTQFIGRTFACEGVTGPARNACDGTAVLVGMRFNLTRPLYVYPLGLLGFVVVSFTLATLLLTFYHPGGVKHAASQESKPAKAAEAIEQEKEHLLQREGVDVKIEKLGLTVSSRSLLHPTRGQEKVILAEVNASFPRGEVSVIMGPSGAGKSSLLQILSSRLSGGLISDFSTSGTVLLNDQPLGPSTAAFVSFVQQEDDHHLPALTVRETLRYAAKLRLRGKTGAQCDARAEEVLKMLGLSPCADNIVGGELLKGISGGERRRLSLAVEMLADPAILLADEPLSGLDAFTARAVMETLKNLAVAGRTVVVSVHQPRGDIWEMFDNVLLLAKGGVTAFSGSRSGILETFQSVGETCPTDFNPADFVLDSISVDHRSDEAEVTSSQRVDRIVQAWSDRKTSETHSSLSASTHTYIDNKRSKSPFFTAFPVVLGRSFKNLARGKDALIARCINPPFMALLFWIFFGRLGYGPSSAQDRVGLIQETAALPFVGMLSCLAIFPIEKQLFLHEYNSSARQGVFTFLLGYTVQETIASIVSSLLFSIVFVYGMNMQDSARIFFEFWFTSWSLVSTGESFGLIFASFFSSGGLAVAMTSAAITLLAQINGVISVTIPFWLEVVGWISPMKPQVRVQLINEMRGLRLDCTDAQVASGACIARTGEQLLQTFDIAPVNTAKFVGIAVALVVFWRMLAFGALKLRTLTV